MKNKKRGQAGIVSALLIVLSSLVLVSAVATNSTNDSFNKTFQNVTLDNFTFANESSTTSEALNLTVPIKDETIINQSNPEKIKDLSEIIEKNRNKLNDETEKYFKNLTDKEQRKFIIKFRNSINETKLSKVNLEKKIDKFKLASIKGKAEDLEDLIDDNEIEFLELDQDVEILGDNIPLNIQKTKADTVWNLSNGSGVKVAVLDTGIALHDDLAIAGGVSFVDDNYYDSNGHGTAVAGVVAGLLNNQGLVGVAPSVDLYSVKIMQGSTGDLSNAIAGIEWAIDNNMSVVSMSFGFDSYSQIFKEVLQEAYNNNIVLVAASGNNGQDNILYPAKYDSVIAVGAVDENNNLASFSSYGFEQELVAHGVDINSTSSNNSYSVLSGTSLAAPHVAGVAALIKAYNNSLTNEQIRAKLRNDALDLGAAEKDDLFGYGLVQINLTTNNFTFVNNSYFYEIFNITDYGLSNQSYWFWLNGTGTVDDVHFEQGYYLVNITFNDGRKKSNIYNVSENGTMFILALTLENSDDFGADGTSNTDGIVWVNENYSVRLTGSNPALIDVECFDSDAFVGNLDYCYSASSSLMSSCDNYFGKIACKVDTQCDSNSETKVYHSFVNTATAKSGSVYSNYYQFCSSTPQREEPNNHLTYYVLDKKRARCLNSSHYVVEGHYGSGNWIQLGNQQNCGTETCIDSANYTNKNAYINPCIAANLCPGKVQIITEDSNGNPLSNLLVSRDDVSNKITDAVGVADYNLSKNCGQSMQFTVYCSNSSGATVCGTKSTSLDFIGDYDSLMFDCAICNGKSDLKVSLGGVNISADTNKVTINFTIENVATVSNVNITVKAQDKNTGLISAENYSLVNINSGDKSKVTTIALNLNNADFVHVYVDASNPPKVNEPKTNNYVAVPVITDKVKAYISVDTGLSNIDQAIKDYLKLFVIPTSQNNADIKIAVSLLDKNQLVKDEKPSSRNKKWYVDSSSIYFNGASLGQLPYTGIVATEDCFFCTYDTVFAVGTDIDGIVAAVKRLIDARTLYLKKVNASIEPSVIEKTDTLGLSVYDLMHNPENRDYYRQNNANFANVVTKILADNNYEVAIKTVRTYNDNTTLRLKNINSDFSQNFKNVIVNNSKPIVLSRGIHSNLFTWEDFGKELAFDEKSARDTWLIEMVGGPTIDEDCKPSGAYNCPNYTFTDLKTYYWPALIAGVEEYSGQNQIDYAGFSLGCSVALESLKLYGSSGKNNAGYYLDTDTGNYLVTNLATNPVDSFIAVACPGNFTRLSTFIQAFNETFGFVNWSTRFIYGNHIVSKNINTEILDVLEITDPTLYKQFSGLIVFFAKIGSGNRLSMNIYNEFYDWINGPSKPDLGKNVSLNNLMVIQGDSDNYLGMTDNTDMIVPVEDLRQVCKNVNSNNKYYLNFPQALHAGAHVLPDNKNVKKSIKEFLNNKKILAQDLLNQYLISNTTSCDPG